MTGAIATLVVDAWGEDPEACTVCGVRLCEKPEHGVGASPNRESCDDAGSVDAVNVRAQFPESWQLLDDVEVMELPDPQWAIEGLLPERGVAVIYGPSGSCKTTIIASLLGSLATGRDFFGRRVASRGPSVYVAAEDPSGFKVRLGAWKRAQRIPPTQVVGVYTFPDVVNLSDPVEVARFEQFLRESDVRPRTLVVDTYAAATAGSNENSSEDVTIALQHARQWQVALGCLVIVVHHTNASGARERGHTGLRAGVDTMISLTPVDDLVKVECSKQRNGPPFEPFDIKLVPVPGGAGCALRLAGEVLPAGGFSVQQRKVFEVLRDTFAADGATKGEWQRACLDIPERTFFRATKILLEDGHVRQVGSHFRVSGGGA